MRTPPSQADFNALLARVALLEQKLSRLENQPASVESQPAATPQIATGKVAVSPAVIASGTSAASWTLLDLQSIIPTSAKSIECHATIRESSGTLTSLKSRPFADGEEKTLVSVRSSFGAVDNGANVEIEVANGMLEYMTTGSPSSFSLTIHAYSV